FGRAVRFARAVRAAEDVRLGRPPHVVADEQIDETVAVVVDPHRGRAESRAPAETGAVRHVDEASLADVVKQATLPDGGDEDVLASVVVVVSRGHTHPVHRYVEPRAGGDVLEPAVTRVPE